MFTGIIEAQGAVKSVEKKGVSGRIHISAGIDLTVSGIGGSIAINGVCLTITTFDDKGFVADISDETLRSTTLGVLVYGSPVNIERALTLTKPLGGHLVTGHVDGIGRLTGKRRSGAGAEFEFSAPEALLRQIVRKGSVAVDGLSLTVAALTDNGFTVAVIPHTLATTTFGNLKIGAEVNIETDIIGKYVDRYLSGRAQGGITEGFLAEHGFLPFLKEG
ncbi:MAG: riboflavin synthase [Deltaproteobacteria bacterium]|nr:riboflavin synthase [Deltaproteobacteria bacterium]